METMTTIPALATRLAMDGLAGRRLVALAGPPGAGKSTLAAALANQLGPDACAVVPMDGFHLDDGVLNARGWRARKGAPHTFDVAGLLTALRRLRAADEPEVALPLFDRSLELSRAGALIVPASVPLVLVEGNYLLLRTPPWDALAPLFDLTAMVAVPEPVLAARLAARWAGLDPIEAQRRLEANDMPNGRLVMAESRAADFTIDGTAPAK